MFVSPLAKTVEKFDAFDLDLIKQSENILYLSLYELKCFKTTEF